MRMNVAPKQVAGDLLTFERHDLKNPFKWQLHITSVVAKFKIVTGVNLHVQLLARLTYLPTNQERCDHKAQSAWL